MDLAEGCAVFLFGYHLPDLVEGLKNAGAGRSGGSMQSGKEKEPLNQLTPSQTYSLSITLLKTGMKLSCWLFLCDVSQTPNFSCLLSLVTVYLLTYTAEGM